jgi:superoxide reductase
MTARLQIYKCEVCGNIVEVLHAGQGKLVCCAQPMTLMTEKTQEQGQEKHLPVVEAQGEGLRIKVGEIPHPMEESHHIEWIQFISGHTIFRRFLDPGEAAEAFFSSPSAEGTAREYCNIHGLWKK